MTLLHNRQTRGSITIIIALVQSDLKSYFLYSQISFFNIFTPGERALVPIVQEAEWALGLV